MIQQIQTARAATHTMQLEPGHSLPLTTDAQRPPVSLSRNTKLMEDQCVFSQCSTASAADFAFQWPEEARGHLPLVPSSVGLPHGDVSAREGVTWRWDLSCAEGSNLPSKDLQPLTTHPERALPLLSTAHRD